MKNSLLIASFLVCLAAGPTLAAAEGLPADLDRLLKQKEQELLTLQKEYAAVQEKLKNIEGRPAITRDSLSQRNYRRLKDVAADVKSQRQTLAELEGFVKWMTSNLSGYSKYIEAGSVAAGLAKILPIPYAGQASVFTKFISQGILSLNAASASINRYLVTSQQFVAKVEAIDPRQPKGSEVAEAGRFADVELLRDMSDLRSRLASTAELSASTLSFLESLNHYVGSTDEYWKKTKSLITRNEEKKEKSFLSESIGNLRNKAGSFSGRLKSFEDVAHRNMPLIKTLGAYDELIRELDSPLASVK